MFVGFFHFIGGASAVRVGIKKADGMIINEVTGVDEYAAFEPLLYVQQKVKILRMLERNVRT